MIVLQGISKSYRTPEGRKYLFRDLNLIIPEGRSLGIIGRNGAGKSTLLRILGGIDKPDRGKVIAGEKRISWPVGFRGVLRNNMTGCENAKLVCRLYESKEKFSEKMAFTRSFSELGPYFDMPVDTYSTGMRARLAFALSMAFDFDCYVIDEVMAVGDAGFRKKCFAIMRRKRKQADFILASRNMKKIRKYCDLILFLGRHEARLYEEVGVAIKAYREEEGLDRNSEVAGRARKGINTRDATTVDIDDEARKTKSGPGGEDRMIYLSTER